MTTSYGPADYILKFNSKQEAVQFGLDNGYVVEEQGELYTVLATTSYALHIIGEHYVNDVSDGKHWVLFRDLVGIPFPDTATTYVVWASWMTHEIPDPEDPEKTIVVPLPRPTDDPTIPNSWWV